MREPADDATPIVVTETLTKASRFLMILVFPNQQALSDERRAQCDSAFNRDAVFPFVKVLREGGSHHIAGSSSEVWLGAVWTGGSSLLVQPVRPVQIRSDDFRRIDVFSRIRRGERCLVFLKSRR